MNQLESNPKERIIEILNELAVDFQEEAIDDQIRKKLHRVVLKCDKDNQSFIFKYQINQSENQLFQFQNEIEALIQIQQNRSVVSVLNSNKVIKYSLKDEFWMFLTFTEGSVTGNFFDFNKEILTPDFTDYSIKTLSAISLLKFDWSKKYAEREKKRALSTLESFGADEYLIKHKDDLKKIFDDSEEYFDKIENYLFTHCDLTPLNILKANKKEYSVIDWESAGYSLKVFDPVIIYTRSYPNPEWQSNFYKRIIKERKFNEEDIKVFKLSVLLRLAGFMGGLKKLISIHKTSLYQDKNLPMPYVKELLYQTEKRFEVLLGEIK